MGIALRLPHRMRQIKLLRLWQELLVHAPAANDHNFRRIAASGNRHVDELHPLHAIVGARLAADNNILRPGKGRPMNSRCDVP